MKISSLSIKISIIALFSSASSAHAAVIGSDITVYNTLIDAQTGGAEIFIANVSATGDSAALEFDDFLGLYDVDFMESSATMTLIGNSALDGVPLLFPGAPDARFDTYYYFIDNHDVTSVDLTAGSGDLANFATVGIVPAGALTFANQSFTTTTDGMFIAFGPGSDYTNVAPANPLATAGFSFTAEAIPEPSSVLLLAISGLFLGSRRRR